MQQTAKNTDRLTKICYFKCSDLITSPAIRNQNLNIEKHKKLKQISLN